MAMTKQAVTEIVESLMFLFAEQTNFTSRSRVVRRVTSTIPLPRRLQFSVLGLLSSQRFRRSSSASVPFHFAI